MASYSNVKGLRLQRDDWHVDANLALMPHDKLRARGIVPAVYEQDNEGHFIQVIEAHWENSHRTLRAVVFGDLLSEEASGFYMERTDKENITYSVYCHYEACSSIIDVPKILATRAMGEVDLFIFRMFHSEFSCLTEQECQARERPRDCDSIPGMRANWLRWLAYKYLAVVRWICDQYGNSRTEINDSEPPCSIILTWPTQGDIAKYNEHAWGELSNDIKSKRLSTFNRDFFMYKEDFKTIWTAISSIPLASEFLIFQECYGRAARELEHTVTTYSAGAGVMEDYRPIWDPVKPFLDRGLKLSKAGVGRLLRGSAQINKKRGSCEPRTGSEATRPHAKVLDAVAAYDKDLKSDLVIYIDYVLIN